MVAFVVCCAWVCVGPAVFRLLSTGRYTALVTCSGMKPLETAILLGELDLTLHLLDGHMWTPR